MMSYVLGVLLLVSLFINIVLIRKKQTHNEQIKYVEQKLKAIIDQETAERLLLYTDEVNTQSLLIQINRLLNHNQHVIANYHRIERSMRKILSNISHDLKTPLTVILGYIEMLEHDQTLSMEKQKNVMKTIHLKSQEVLDLINRFFELVKLESGDKQLQAERIDVGEICRQKILEYYDILINKQFEVFINIPDEAVFIVGDTHAIDRILNNLLSNAIAYGADGKMIGLNVITTEKIVHIEVIDHGKGISEIHQDRVFERMYTLEDSRNARYQGSGLGLTITKRLVEQMGGTILLKSVPYEKTTFTVAFNRLMF